ncbi:uncharacterized protein LOC103506806 [Diaphorina citri]|uniref:N-acetylmuramoyl-L-alanine amidase n=1 Tax=Diaphorina citri TaxID=121845 RepID=A0A1S3CWZ6_DIACI|nr:uncharacterized protein LOC103506806 [Diaphorina citri]
MQISCSKTIFIFFVVVLFLIICYFNFPREPGYPILQVFPRVFKRGSGIYVMPSSIHGMPGYVIDPFPEWEKNRNHYDSRDGMSVKYLILHYTVYNFAHIITAFTSNRAHNLHSSHYVISEKEGKYLPGGKVIQIVPDNMRAWHAGIGKWRRDRNLNSMSIGIHLVNGGVVGEKFRSTNYYPFDENQIHTLGLLGKDIVSQFKIKPQYVLGHTDIAPGSKMDPGPLFPWGKLYLDYGIGAWLSPDEMTVEAIVRKFKPARPYPRKLDRGIFLELLKAYGYNVTITNKRSVIRAFKTHFSANQNPERIYADITTEDMFWAWALVAKYGSM